MTGNRWLQMIDQNPDHSAWYTERFRRMAEEGHDLHGEARFVDAMAGRGARILDAGCGPGRVGGRLTELGHDVTGVDIDPALIDAARSAHPDTRWIVGDLAELDLAATGHPAEFDVIVCAGNVITFLDPATLDEVMSRLGRHLASDGRLAVGFGRGRGVEFTEFEALAATAGLAVDLRLSTWDLRPFTPESDFLVEVLVSDAAAAE